MLLKNCTIYQPGFLENQNILLLYERRGIDQNDIDRFGGAFEDGLMNIGIKISQFFMVTVERMNSKEETMTEISKFPNIKYFLMIGITKNYALMKSIKLTMDIRGNFKPISDVRAYMLEPEELFRFCLEVNKQCRGVNYPCPRNFPKNVAFFHYILRDDQISCGTNATKKLDPHTMLQHGRPGETNYIEDFEYLCTKVTGKLKNKEFKKVIITFNNYLSLKCSNQIANELYEIAERYFPSAAIGIAKLLFKKESLLKDADKNQILSCTSLSYQGELTRNKILEYLFLCRNCNEIRLNVDEKTNLPEHIRLSIIHICNTKQNYRDYELPMKIELVEDDFVPLPIEHPKVKQRNHLINLDDDYFVN